MDRITLIREFVKTIDEYIEVENDNRFCVDIEEEIIYIPYELNEEEDRIWSQFLKQEFNVDFNPYLMSVLHEIGHIVTYTEDLNEERNVIYFLLQMKYEEDNFEEFNREYFNIPMEYHATEWAINYYRNHEVECNNIICKLSEV